MIQPAKKLDASSHPTTDFEILSTAKTVLGVEADALTKFTKSIPVELAEAVRMVQACQGCVVVSGIGKAGWIGQKISASLASTGTRSHFLHPAEAFHGDFGRVHSDDLVLVLSNSGETEEVVRMIPSLRKSGAQLMCITGNEKSTLATNCDCVVPYGRVNEACSNGLAPSTSTTLMLAIGDAIALTVSCFKGFTSIDFAQFHPGGSLGRKLQTVDEIMRPLHKCRTTHCNESIREAIASQAKHGRRTGAILVVDEAQRLMGIFTDSDLVKLLEQKNDSRLDQPISESMTATPIHIESGQFVSEAIDILSDKCISELPVVDQEGQALGMIDITDVVS